MNREQLRSLAEAAKDAYKIAGSGALGIPTPSIGDFERAVTPEVVLELLDEIEGWKDAANMFNPLRRETKAETKIEDEAWKHLGQRDWPEGSEWKLTSYRGEYQCPHGIGHGNHVHGCDGCCRRDDYPLKVKKDD